jgi:hypothetical protein
VTPPAEAEPLAVGMDIGGTKIAGGVVTRDGRVLDRTKVPTPPYDQEATAAALLAVTDELLARNPGVEAIGLGAAGMVEWPGGQARWAPHNTYRRMELRRLLHERTGLPTGPRPASAPGPAPTTWCWSPSAPGSAAGWCWTAASTTARTGSRASSGT